MNLSDAHEKKKFQDGLAVILTKVANLTGLKDPIHPINKRDIAQMIVTLYKTLSLEEIDYAFRIDRYGYHGEPTKHYQLFNAEFVTTVLIKYEKWKRTTLRSCPPTRFEDKHQAKKVLVNKCFKEYRETGKLFRSWTKSQIYEAYWYMYSRGFLPSHTELFKEKYRRKVVKRMYKAAEEMGVFAKRRRIYKLKGIQIGEKLDSYLCIYMTVETFFRKLIAQEKEMQDLL
ncbi:hypothetical protein APR41_02135 [Salegentibacter salinarum]|uniref:Uncharacterized protein n=2 Tax=Salegentibacter salinarum TaxID=447422 RepID=A0A2N0U467_9FLAO|nr:hypothetical protein APR41_02135 [Salegentibacter salinarum]SKB33461.1 hypothetical protein SAMN05660903_00132 [Salegentibacter salinarum]